MNYIAKQFGNAYGTAVSIDSDQNIKELLAEIGFAQKDINDLMLVLSKFANALSTADLINKSEHGGH